MFELDRTLGTSIFVEVHVSGDIYEQAVVKTVVGFLYGISKHLFGVTRFRGATRFNSGRLHSKRRGRHASVSNSGVRPNDPANRYAFVLPSDIP